MRIQAGVGPGKTQLLVACRLNPTHSASTFGVSTTYQNSGPTTDTPSPRVIIAVVFILTSEMEGELVKEEEWVKEEKGKEESRE